MRPDGDRCPVSTQSGELHLDALRPSRTMQFVPTR
jgi:hypothetical protein